MGKTLIVGEKGSVAAEIAKVLGGFTRKGNVYERDDIVISNASGHLLELAVPDGIDKGWELPNLPVIPPAFALRPIAKTKAQLEVLKELFKRSDITEVVNACDAGREGELIFRYISMYCGNKKPVKRMWIQSMTPGGLKESYANMFPGKDKEGLFHAAQSRSESDFLIGVNATRALTSLRRMQIDDDQVDSGGRVQSPVLTIVYDRHMARKVFVPRDYWEIHGTFGATAGQYVGRWFNPNFSKGVADDAREERVFDQATAIKIEEKCKGAHPTSVTDKSEPLDKIAPLLFDLTSLQKEANGKYGFTASDTLKIAQSLYEIHKATTYPRTDAKALPEDYIPRSKEVLAALTDPAYAPHAKRVLDNDWVKPNKRIFNNAKISDHFAIIPTDKVPTSLSADEAKIYDLVVKRFMAIFHPPATYLKTVRITVVAEESFKSFGSVLKSEGWLAVYGKEAAAEGDEDGGKSLCRVEPNEAVKTLEIKRVGLQTKPPELYTEATLLAAMEFAGQLVDDEELKESMREKGLGTPATRAETIEGLMRRSYLFREKKNIDITNGGIQIVRILLDNDLQALTSPRLTGEWEYKLAQMEQGKITRSEFMKEIQQETHRIVEQIRKKASTMPMPEVVTLKAACPKCAGEVKAMPRGYSCGGCGLKVPKELLGRKLTLEEVEVLFANGTSAQLSGFLSAKGKLFKAALAFSPDYTKFDFVFDNAPPAAPTGDDRKVVGNCPKCSGDVIVNEPNYDCEKRFGESKSCDFRIWGEIAKKRVSVTVAKKLLANKKSDLIEGFVSSKSGNKFSAYLVLKDGKVEFDFPPRDKK